MLIAAFFDAASRPQGCVVTMDGTHRHRGDDALRNLGVHVEPANEPILGLP
jgi:hypothetical protein